YKITNTLDRREGMLPRERQEKIKEFIQVEENMRIADLSQLLGVSEMTIHRDIKPMMQEGLIIKTFGRIALAQESKAPPHVNVDTCVFCSRNIQGNLTYRLILENNTIELACCAHCGLLRHRQHGERVVQALCTDFFKQTTISAVNAWYVMDATVDIGCCYPQVLTFA